MEAPNKIWLSKFEEDPGDNEYGIFEQWSLEPISNAKNEEYIRKDLLLGWMKITESNYPPADKKKLYCVRTKGHYFVAKVVENPNDDNVLQWKSTEFPFRRYDMCDGDYYLDISRKEE